MIQQNIHDGEKWKGEEQEVYKRKKVEKQT